METHDINAPITPTLFALHRFNGTELYRFTTADMYAYMNDAGGVTLWFEATGDPDAIQRCEDTAEARCTPKAEAGVLLAEFDISYLVGTEFCIPGVSSDEEDSCMSLFCYFESEPLKNSRIRVISRAGDHFRVHWSAETQDVNYYDGSKPLTRIEVVGDFLFKDIDQWEKPSIKP